MNKEAAADSFVDLQKYWQQMVKQSPYDTVRAMFGFHREMITSQLQGKLWLYDEVRTRLCLFCHHQIGEDCWDS
ncbi:hypothetical protein Tco_0530044 [Tanacetum coccineum]